MSISNTNGKKHCLIIALQIKPMLKRSLWDLQSDRFDL